MPVLDIQFLCFPNAKVHVWQKMAFCQHQKQGTDPVQNFQLLPSDNNMNSKYHNMHITIPVDFTILLIFSLKHLKHQDHISLQFCIQENTSESLHWEKTRDCQCQE